MALTSTNTTATMTSVIYCRVSQADVRQKRSVPQQEAESRAVASEHEWTVPDNAVFVEKPTSASRFTKKARPQYMATIDYLRTKKPNVLILWEVSRITRKLGGGVDLLDLCRDLRIRIHVVSLYRTFDPAEQYDREALVHEFMAAERESEQISKRTLRDMRDNAAKGRPHGRVLYGYQRVYDDKRRFVEQVIREDQAKVIREAAQRVANGETMYVVAQDFNRRGIPTPVSGPWDISKIRGLISKPSYIGKRAHHGNLTDAMWPAILDEKTWQACVDKLNDPTRKTYRDTAIKHIMSGIATCGAVIKGQTCGSVVRPQNNNGIPSYLCSAHGHVSIPIQKLDEYVEQQIRERLITVKLVGDDDEQRQELLREAGKLETRIAEIEAELPSATGRAVTALTKAINDLDNQREDLLRQARTSRTEPTVGILISNPEKWDDLTLPEKRNVLRSGSLVDSIEIMPVGRRSGVPIGERVEITWTETRLSTDPQS